MVFVGHFARVPRQYLAIPGFYRIEPDPAGGYNVYLDPPEDPIGPPIVEAIDGELEN